MVGCTKIVWSIASIHSLTDEMKSQCWWQAYGTCVHLSPKINVAFPLSLSYSLICRLHKGGDDVLVIYACTPG